MVSKVYPSLRGVTGRSRPRLSRVMGKSAAAQTCVDVVGQPQINVVDFNGQSGADYVTRGEGKSFIVTSASSFFPNTNIVFGFWFNTTTETQPDLSAQGVTQYIEVDILPTSGTSDITAALHANSPYVSALDVVQINGGDTNSAAQFTATTNQNFSPATDVNTGAAFSQTQPGYPSGHYCTPTSDALDGILFAFRGQCTYLGVTNNAGGLGKPGYTTQDLSGNQLLFQDSAMTIPAVNKDDTVAGWKDPVSGLSAIQTNSMNAYTLQFAQQANGMLAPYLQGSASAFLSVAQNSALNFGDNFTICATALNSSGTTYQQILSKGSGAYGVSIYQGLLLATKDLVGFVMESSVPWGNQYRVAVWQRITGSNNVFTFDGSDVSTSSTAQTLSDTSDPLLIGSESGGGSNFLGPISSVFLAKGNISSGNLAILDSYADSLHP